MMPFRDRKDAGQLLAARLLPYRHKDAVVLGLPKGGVVVAAEVARLLALPLDVLVVGKIVAPSEHDLAIGAVAEGEERYVDTQLALDLELTNAEIDTLTRRAHAEVERRVVLWRRGRHTRRLAAHPAIVVDDGIATGNTVRVALRALQLRGPAGIVLAAPVASSSALASLRDDVDDIVVLEERPFLADVGEAFEKFDPVSDDEVAAILARVERERTAMPFVRP